VKHSWMAVALLATAACTASEAESDEPAPAAGAMSSEARWSKVQSAQGRVLMEVAARVVADVQGAAEITTLYSGQVLKVLVQPGDKVTEGAPVAEIAVPELSSAVAQLDSANAQLVLLNQRADALQGLLKDGLARQAEVFEVQTQVAELQALRGLALAKVRSAGLSGADRRRLVRQGRLALKSPVQGVVTDVHLHLGQTVNPDGQALVQVQGRGSSRVEVQLPSRLPPGAQVQFVGYDGQSHGLQDAAVSSALDPETGTLRSWLSLKDARLPSGLRGTVVVRGGSQSWFEVPAQAVVDHAGKASVFSRRSQQRGWVPVSVQLKSGSTAIVQGELQDGDEVLADGRVAPAVSTAGAQAQ